MQPALRLIIFGRQGAGKGSQCARLAAHFGIPHISTGDMLRASAATGSEFGRTVKAIMDDGGLVSDEIMEGVVRERLAMPDAEAGFLLDGYPRTPPQAEFLNSILAPGGVDLAINLEVPEDVVLERITKRRVCVTCGHIYSVDSPPKNGWLCDVDGGEVVQRADDTEDAVRKRLDLYAAETLPLVPFYAERHLLVEVDGLGSPDEVFDRLLAAVESRRQA